MYISKQAAKEQDGWWLDTHGGKLYPVGYKGHRDYIMDNPELFGPTNYRDAYDHAFKQGWIRISYAIGSLNFETDAPLTDSQLSKIKRILDQLPVVKTAYIF